MPLKDRMGGEEGGAYEGNREFLFSICLFPIYFLSKRDILKFRQRYFQHQIFEDRIKREFSFILSISFSYRYLLIIYNNNIV